jgi:GMP synthase (glutamine-hydrolysing)
VTTTIAVLQHEPATGLGRFADVLARLGVCHEIVWTTHRPLPDLRDFDGAFVLGGSLAVRDLRLQPARRWIRDAVDNHVPYLGVCLGGQLLASALGARVRRGGAEVGVHSIFLTEAAGCDPLFRGLPRRLDVFGFHGEAFALPRGAVPLAGSPACTYQAFRYGASAYGLQFHPEVRARDLDRWRHVACYRRLLAESGREWSELTSELEAAGTLDDLAADLLEHWVHLVRADTAAQARTAVPA